MIGLTEKDFGLLLFASLAKKCIININKPLTQRSLFRFTNDPIYKVLFQGLYVRKDEFNNEEGYVELSRAFSSCNLNGTILINNDVKNGNSIFIQLDYCKANEVIEFINKKYGKDYSILMNNMIDLIDLEQTKYVDLNNKVNSNSLILKTNN